MRTFQKTSACTLPDTFCRGKFLSGCNVNFTLDNPMNAVIIRAVAHEIGVTVLEVQRGVNAVLLHINRLRPFAVNIIRPDVKITAF